LLYRHTQQPGKESNFNEQFLIMMLWFKEIAKTFTILRHFLTRRFDTVQSSCFLQQDSRGYLRKELDSWEIWNLDPTRSSRSQLKDMVSKWYD